MFGSRHLFRQSLPGERLLKALKKRLLPLISGSPKMPYLKVPQHIGQPADMIELRVRCDDMVDSPDAPVPQIGRDYATPHVKPLIGGPTVYQDDLTIR
jgi:hypothetical protein